MFTLRSAALLALLGSAFAAPLAHRQLDGTPQYGRVITKVVTVTPEDVNVDVTTKTVYVYANGQPADQGDAPAATYSYSAPAAPAASTAAAEAPASSAAASAAAPAGTGYMAIVNEWRSKGGLPTLTQSSLLEGNALKTVNNGHGQMVHELNAGTFAQVLAPGTSSDFEHVYVGGWLCERPNLPGLDGICASQDSGWEHNGETGHADILTSTQYTKIGCALAFGIWGCDLA